MTITDTNDIIALTLLNVTIMAADRRGGRRILNASDFIAYKSMMEAAGTIGTGEQAQVQRRRPEAIESGEAPAQATGAQLPPNTL